MMLVMVCTPMAADADAGAVVLVLVLVLVPVPGAGAVAVAVTDIDGVYTAGCAGALDEQGDGNAMAGKAQRRWS